MMHSKIIWQRNGTNESWHQTSHHIHILCMWNAAFVRGFRSRLCLLCHVFHLLLLLLLDMIAPPPAAGRQQGCIALLMARPRNRSDWLPWQPYTPTAAPPRRTRRIYSKAATHKYKLVFLSSNPLLYIVDVAAFSISLAVFYAVCWTRQITQQPLRCWDENTTGSIHWQHIQR